MSFGTSFREEVAEFEKNFIEHALFLNDWKINQTSREAKIPKKTLLRKMAKYGLKKPAALDKVNHDFEISNR